MQDYMTRPSRNSERAAQSAVSADDSDSDSEQGETDPMWSKGGDPWLQPRKSRHPSLALMTAAGQPIDELYEPLAYSLRHPSSPLCPFGEGRSCGSEVESDSGGCSHTPMLSVCLARSPATSLFAPTWVVPNFALFLRWLWKESCRQIIYRPEPYCGSGEQSERPRPLTLWQQLENMVHSRSNTSVARSRKRGCEQPGE